MCVITVPERVNPFQKVVEVLLNYLNKQTPPKTKPKKQKRDEFLLQVSGMPESPIQ
jgi:hypothetical protein